jgi:hypothetical protein
VLATITREAEDGFDAFWEEGPRRGKLGSQTTSFHAPQLMWHDLTAKGFARILTVVYAVPIRRGECRLFARFPFQFQSAVPKLLIGLRPRWLQHIGNHKVLEDDQVFLHWQERVLERAGGSPAADRAFFMPNTADVYVAALHRWLNNNGGEPFAGKDLPERQRTADLMDRYYSHTQSCRSCSTALRRIRAARPWAWVVLWGAAALVGLGQGGDLECHWCRRCRPCGTHPAPSFSLGERIDPGRRCSPPQPTGLIKATAKATGWVSLSLQHFLQPLLSLPR